MSNKALHMPNSNIFYIIFILKYAKIYENSKRAYYRGAQGCVIVYSCSDKDSFSTVDSWKHRVTNECGDIPMGKSTSGSFLYYFRLTSGGLF